MNRRVCILVALLSWLYVGFVPAGGAVEDPTVNVARALSDAFGRAAEKIERSVVHITTRSEVQRYRQDIFGRRYRVGEPELRPSGLGSGVVIDDDGLVLTNYHVIAHSDELLVRLYDGREISAEVVGSDEPTDLAVLRIEADGLVAAPIGDSDDLRIGEWVLAVGSPFGFESTVTAGIVSAKGRTLSGVGEQEQYQEFIQTDAAVNPGNSGGPLINLDGEVVGINSAIYSATRQSAGLSFAIPSVVVQGVVRSIMESGRVERGYLGIRMAELEVEVRRRLGLRPDEGVLVEHVEAESPADKAGLLAGDIVLRLNGREVIGGLNRLRNLIALARPGSEVLIQVLRDGERVVRSAVLGDRASAVAEAMGGVRVGRLGVVGRTMTREISAQLGYGRYVPGVLVLRVESGMPAADSGIEVGDVLTEVDGRRVDGVGELGKALEHGRSPVQIELIRGRMRGYVEVELE